ncbi:MAG: MFS transporter [Pirellulales bacterium]
MNATSLRGFTCLNVTQFLGAANDNILKQVLVFGLAMGGVWNGVLGEGGQAWASLCLAIPFVAFSGFAGQFADKYSKQQVAIVTKWSEIAIALIAIWGLWLQNVWLVLGSLVLIATQSTFFSPAKFGMLPEMVSSEKLSRANGTVNMFTYLAIIIGAAVGGPLYECYVGDHGKLLQWLPGIVILLVGVLGTAASHGLPPLTARNPEKPISYRLFSGYVDTWKQTRGTALRAVLVAWTLFYMIIGGIAVLILPDYKEILDITYTQASVLLALLGISIGVGDYAAGAVSGHQIRPGLILYGIVANTVFYLALGLAPPNYAIVTCLLVAGGFMCGFVMVPLQTMVQHLASDEDRGEVLGLWNCLSFVGVTAGNVIFIAVKQMGVRSDQVFLVCAGFTLLFTLLYLWRWATQFHGAVTETTLGE